MDELKARGFINFCYWALQNAPKPRASYFQSTPYQSTCVPIPLIILLLLFTLAFPTFCRVTDTKLRIPTCLPIRPYNIVIVVYLKQFVIVVYFIFSKYLQNDKKKAKEPQHFWINIIIGPTFCVLTYTLSIIICYDIIFFLSL